MSFSLVKYILLAALRDRFLIAIVALMSVGISLSIFIGSSAVIEADRFALVFASSGLRLAGVFALILFTVFYLRRSFDSKDIEMLLSRPIGRLSFILSHVFAFSLIAASLAAVVIIAIYNVFPSLVGGGHFMWSATIVLEYIMMANIALFFAMVLPNAVTSTMAVMALYLLGRLMGQILGIIDAGLLEGGALNALAVIMHFISFIVPRFDLMGQSAWLIYGDEEIVKLPFLWVHSVIITCLYVAATNIDLIRRQF